MIRYRLRGSARGLDGAATAEWRSIATAVVFSGTPIVFYRWEGQTDEDTGQIYGGGRFVFDDFDLSAARGYFYI